MSTFVCTLKQITTRRSTKILLVVFVLMSIFIIFNGYKNPIGLGENMNYIQTLEYGKFIYNCICSGICSFVPYFFLIIISQDILQDYKTNYIELVNCSVKGKLTYISQKLLCYLLIIFMAFILGMALYLVYSLFSPNNALQPPVYDVLQREMLNIAVFIVPASIIYVSLITGISLITMRPLVAIIVVAFYTFFPTLFINTFIGDYFSWIPIKLTRYMYEFNTAFFNNYISEYNTSFFKAVTACIIPIVFSILILVLGIVCTIKFERQIVC